MKKQRIGICVLVLLVAFSPLFAQGASDSDQGKTLVLKFSDQVNEDNPHLKADRHFAELVNAAGVGLDVQVFPNSQLGTARESLEGMNSGTVEITKVSAGELNVFAPEFSLFSLPYIFVSKNEVKSALEGEVGDILKSSVRDAGFELLAFYDTGFRSIFNGKRPVTSMEDLNGLKIRVINDPIMIETVNTLGGIATPLAYSELYTALRQGVVDGAEQPAVALYAQKFYEVSTYYSLTNHFYDCNVVVMSKKVYDSLTAEQQKIIKDAAAKTQEFEWDLWNELEKEVLNDLRAEGMIINELDLQSFRDATNFIVDKNSDMVGEEILKAARKYIQ